MTFLRAFALLVAASTTSAAAPGELLTNPGFEEWIDEGPRAWRSDDASASEDAADLHSGRRALLVSRPTRQAAITSAMCTSQRWSR